MAGGSINFAIYDDRIEIWNNGSLMPGLDYSGLQFIHESVRRNPLIANVFYYRKLSEAWGRGIELIVQKCLEEGLPEPEFFERSGGFCVCLRSGKSTKEEGAEWLLDSPSTRLPVRQEEILKCFASSGKMTLSELIDNLETSVSERTVQRDLSQLQQLDLIMSEGFGRGAKWQLSKRGH